MQTPALAVAQEVSYDYDRSANFAGFKTCAHKAGTATRVSTTP